MRKDKVITKVTEQLAPTVLNYTIRGLTATTNYTIEVSASTRIGPGPISSADISSGVPPVTPEPPRNLALTNIRANTVLLQFVPGFSGYTSISKWIIQAQTNGIEDPVTWGVIYEVSDPTASALTVRGLLPYTRYRLRIIAENIANKSQPSEPTRWFETIQAEPSGPPSDVSVRAYNETSIRVRWNPLTAADWNGEQRGYRIEYTSVDPAVMSGWQTVNVDNENANSFMLIGLEEWTEYQVRVAAFNKVGVSSDSPIVKEATRESVPSAGPANITAAAVNSTTIRVTWGEVPKIHQNGLIRGCKVSCFLV
jgi:protein sidekick